MKVSVASKKQKILQAILAVLILVPSAFYYAYNKTKLFKTNIIVCTVVVFAFDLAIIISACIALFSNVVIDENGITLRRGIIKVNRISWEDVRRVEIFKALHRRSVFFSDTYVRISTTEEESWAYQYRMSPLNVEAESISFTHNDKVDELIKQYYKGDICR